MPKFKGNGFYGEIEVNNKEEAIGTILYLLNTHQIGWDVVYVNELVEYFELNKNDFLIKDIHFTGVYNAYYKPHHHDRELIEIEEFCKKKYEESLVEKE